MAGLIHRDDGWSLMELMMVVFILGILVAIAVASFYLSTARATEATCDANTRLLTSSCNTYAAEYGEYPTELHQLKPYVADDTDFGRCPSNRDIEYEYDPGTRKVTCPIHP